MRTLTSILTAMGVCFITMGLVVGSSRPAYAQTGVAACDLGRTACFVPAGATCGPPETCPAAGQTYPTCECR